MTLSCSFKFTSLTEAGVNWIQIIQARILFVICIIVQLPNRNLIYNCSNITFAYSTY